MAARRVRHRRARRGVVVTPPERDFPQQEYGLGAESKRFGEVFRLAVQSGACALAYEHWVAGERKRGLAHTPEMSGWYVIAGAPEPWETELLGGPVQELGSPRPPADVDGFVRQVVVALGLPRFTGF